MQPVAGAGLGAGAPLTAWYRSLAASERLALALSLSLALHAGSALLLPAPPLHPAVRRGGAGALTVALRPSAPPLPPSPSSSGGGLPAAFSPVISTVATQALPRAGAMPGGSDDAGEQAAPEASTPASALLAAPAGEGAAGAEGEGYFAAAELDVQARPLQPISLALPPDAPAGEVRLMLRVYINEQGGVDAVESEQPDPSGVLEREARRAFQGARFVPGQRHGRAVKSYKRIEVWMEN